MVLPILSLLLQAVPPPAADRPVRVWLEPVGPIATGQAVRVFVETRVGGHVLALRSSTEGHIEVLFPVNPGEGTYVPPGSYEIRRPGDAAAFVAAEPAGTGVVVVAVSPTPFRSRDPSRETAWRTGDAGEGPLLDLVQHEVGDGYFNYDVATYVVAPPPSPAPGPLAESTPGYGSPPCFGCGYGYLDVPLIVERVPVLVVCDPVAVDCHYVPTYGYGLPFYGSGWGTPFYGPGTLSRGSNYCPAGATFCGFDRPLCDFGCDFTRERVLALDMRRSPGATVPSRRTVTPRTPTPPRYAVAARTAPSSPSASSAIEPRRRAPDLRQSTHTVTVRSSAPAVTPLRGTHVARVPTVPSARQVRLAMTRSSQVTPATRVAAPRAVATLTPVASVQTVPARASAQAARTVVQATGTVAALPPNVTRALPGRAATATTLAPNVARSLPGRAAPAGTTSRVTEWGSRTTASGAMAGARMRTSSMARAITSARTRVWTGGARAGRR